MSAQAFPYKVHLWEITQKASKEEQSFLHASHRPDLIYMYTKYHQNISKGTKVIERTNFYLGTDRQINPRLIAISPEPCQSGIIKRQEVPEYNKGPNLRGDLGETVSLIWLTTPNFQLMLSSHQRRFDGAFKRRAKRHQSITKLV